MKTLPPSLQRRPLRHAMLAPRQAEPERRALRCVDPPLDFSPRQGKTPFPFHRIAAQWLRERDRALLADEMGLGKTAEILLALVAPAIVVCPASLRLNWLAECQFWRPDLRCRIISPGEALPKPGANEVLIISYASLPEPQKLVTKWLVPHHLSSDTTLVLDEAQYVMNPASARARKVWLLSNQCRRVWAISGTPLEGKPPDLWGVLFACGLSNAVFGSHAKYLEAFGAEVTETWTTKNRKPRKIRRVKYAPTPPGDVAGMLRPHMLRRRRKDVLPELPEKTHATHWVEVPDLLIPDLDLAEADWNQYGTEKLPPFEMLATVRKALAVSRIDAALEFADRYDEEGIPLVVFCAHVEPLKAFEGREGWGVITGETPQELRKVLVDTFQDKGALLNGLAVSLGAGGVGITLTRASHALFIDRDYTPSKNWQGEDRLVRIGQEASAILITTMVGNHPLDIRLSEILGAKGRLIAATLGDINDG